MYDVIVACDRLETSYPSVRFHAEDKLAAISIARASKPELASPMNLFKDALLARL